MKIGIDARLIKQTGVGRFIKNLIHCLSFIDSENEYVIYLKKQDIKLVPDRVNFHARSYNEPWHSFREQLAGPLIFLKDKLDILHVPYFNAPLFYPGKQVITVHDLIYDKYSSGRASTKSAPIFFLKRILYKILIKIILKKAKALGAVSKTTKNELIRIHKIPKEKCAVIYNGVDLDYQKEAIVKNPPDIIGRPYFLYVGNAYPHKNLEFLIEGFIDFAKGKDTSLVLCGGEDYFYQILKNKFRGQNLIFFGEAHNRDLTALYKRARALVIPSLDEGFGLPALEAALMNCPLILSDIPVFREIWSETAWYFDPLKPQSLKEALSMVDRSKEKEKKIKVRGALNKTKRFSWMETAREYLSLYEKAISK